MSTQTTPARAGSTREGRTSARRALLSVAGATLTAVAAWALAGPASGVDLTVRAGDAVQRVGPGAAAAAGLAAGLAAWALLAVLERFTARPRLVFTVVAVAVLLLSLAGPLGQAVGVASTLRLIGVHLAVGAAVICGLAWRRRGRG
ncbi:DUF6069 family protein [Sphaerisporangium sp. NPDC005288]|uniref:DUF6069 family protein n=1 Tax=Sphaerisporangium sp. NPDC005288 TaxID=3155114 RepID=UPI00339E6E41